MRGEVQRVSCGGCRPWTLSKTGHLALPWAAGTSLIQRAGRSVQQWGPAPKPAHRPGNPPGAAGCQSCTRAGPQVPAMCKLWPPPRTSGLYLGSTTRREDTPQSLHRFHAFRLYLQFVRAGLAVTAASPDMPPPPAVHIHQRGLEEAQGFVYIRCGHHGRNIQAGRGRGDQSVIQTGQEEAVFQARRGLLHVPIVVHRLRGEVISHQGAQTLSLQVNALLHCHILGARAQAIPRPLIWAMAAGVNSCMAARPAAITMGLPLKVPPWRRQDQRDP